MAGLATILRCFIIAFRYATTTETRIKMQYDKVFTKEENSQEFMGAAWRDIMPSQVDMEIKHCMIRNEVENCTFT